MLWLICVNILHSCVWLPDWPCLSSESALEARNEGKVEEEEDEEAQEKEEEDEGKVRIWQKISSWLDRTVGH